MARDGQVVTHLNLPCEMEAISTCACAEKNYLCLVSTTFSQLSS